jgi:hypothetical protein
MSSSFTAWFTSSTKSAKSSQVKSSQVKSSQGQSSAKSDLFTFTQLAKLKDEIMIPAPLMLAPLIGLVPNAPMVSTPVTRIGQVSSRPIMSDALPQTRRALLLSLGALGTVFGGNEAATAVENAITEYAKYADKAKRPGVAPKDLGLAKRTINADSIDADPLTFDGLRVCDGKPNCFSTTGDELLSDRILRGVDTLILPWQPPASDTAPFKTLVRAVKAYEPGQGNVDGGGFSVIKEADNYLYVQFEALKKGYIDDVEFATRAGGGIQVRSASRVGTTDFGVNAKRLNFISARLRDQGWVIQEINPKTHPDYFYAAADAADQTFDSDRRKGTGMESSRMDRPSIG